MYPIFCLTNKGRGLSADWKSFAKLRGIPTPQRQFAGYLAEHAFPVAWPRLTKEAHCRVPRSVASVGSEPPPVCRAREEDPDRKTKGAGKMSCHAVNADNQVKPTHDSGQTNDILLTKIAAEPFGQ